MQYQLDDLQAKVIVVAAALLPVVDQVRSRAALQHVFVVHDADLLAQQPSLDVTAGLLQLQAAARTVPVGCEDFLAVVRSGALAPEVAITMDDVALMTYTSGTTGLPKGAMLSYDNALYKTAAASSCNGVQGDDVLRAVAPLHRIAGMLMGNQHHPLHRRHHGAAVQV